MGFLVFDIQKIVFVINLFRRHIQFVNYIVFNDVTMMYVDTVVPLYYSHTIKQASGSGIDQALGKSTYGPPI